MKFISWNVNGLRACVGKDFESQFKALDADFFCLQETKMQEGQLDLEVRGLRKLLELCREEGIFGHSHLYPPPATERELRYGRGGARPRRKESSPWSMTTSIS